MLRQLLHQIGNRHCLFSLPGRSQAISSSFQCTFRFHQVASTPSQAQGSETYQLFKSDISKETIYSLAPAKIRQEWRFVGANDHYTGHSQDKARKSQLVDEIRRVRPRASLAEDRIRTFNRLVDYGLRASDDGSDFLADFSEVVEVLCDVEPVYASKALRNGRAIASLAEECGIPLEMNVMTLGHGHYGLSSDLVMLQKYMSKRPDLNLRKQVLGAYNSLVCRMEALKVPFKFSDVAAYGMYLGAEAHSTSALKYYAALAAQDPIRPKFLEEILMSLRSWIHEDPFNGWEGIRRRKEIVVLLTGRENSPDEYARSDYNFLELFVDLSSADTRSNYLSLLRLLEGPSRVLQAWMEFKQHWRWHQIKGQTGIANAHLIHDVIENLVLGGNPPMAWQVLQELNWEPHQLLGKTWSILLDFPDHIPELQSNMEPFILAKYEEQVKNIEETLGIEWTGGENGSHNYTEEALPQLFNSETEE